MLTAAWPSVVVKQTWAVRQACTLRVMAKKKKQAKKKAQPEPDETHSADELLAIEAIWPECQAHEDRHGFSLRVVPHLGEANHCAVSLNIRQATCLRSALTQPRSC